MKDKILKLVDLAKCSSDLEREIDIHVKNVAMTFIQADTLKYDRCGAPSKIEFIDEWSIDDDGNVNVEWEEFWAYGGHEKGGFSFSSQYLYDDDALQQHVALCEQIKVERENLKKEKQRLADINTLNELKKKLGV